LHVSAAAAAMLVVSTGKQALKGALEVRCSCISHAWRSSANCTAPSWVQPSSRLHGRLLTIFRVVGADSCDPASFCCDAAADDLILPSDYDFASLLPDICDSTDDSDDDTTPGAAAAAYTAAVNPVQHLTDAAAAFNIDGAGPAQTSPVSAAASKAQFQDCSSPEVLPW
jgi:hypothetical protein